VEFISSYAGLMIYEYRYNIDGISFEKKTSDFNDNIISEIYELNKLKIDELKEKKSFTDDVFNKANGKI
jgi:hypothetical protein